MEPRFRRQAPWLTVNTTSAVHFRTNDWQHELVVDIANVDQSWWRLNHTAKYRFPITGME